MPEIKRYFSKAKMNKDLDERIVPNGEYRDAMNIQISTSDADATTGVGNVGVVQNIQGNSEVTETSTTTWNNNNSKIIAKIYFYRQICNYKYSIWRFWTKRYT